eukprot:565534-Rhodomonas_salina.2
MRGADRTHATFLVRRKSRSRRPGANRLKRPTVDAEAQSRGRVGLLRRGHAFCVRLRCDGRGAAFAPRIKLGWLLALGRASQVRRPALAPRVDVRWLFAQLSDRRSPTLAPRAFLRWVYALRSDG